MKTILAATAAMGLALTAVPALAQNMGTMNNQSMQMTAMQKADYQSWTADQQSTYDAWPQPAKDYYWTLNDQQKDVWWNLLTNDQRVRIVQMSPQQRDAAWTSINAQVNNQATGNMANNSSMNNGSMNDGTMNNGAMANGTANIRYVSQGMVQNVPGDQAAYAPGGKVPICSKGETDNCMNAWEAGKRGKGVTQPLGYWPGEPASVRDNNPNR